MDWRHCMPSSIANSSVPLYHSLGTPASSLHDCDDRDCQVHVAHVPHRGRTHQPDNRCSCAGCRTSRGAAYRANGFGGRVTMCVHRAMQSNSGSSLTTDGPFRHWVRTRWQIGMSERSAHRYRPSNSAIVETDACRDADYSEQTIGFLSMMKRVIG